MTTLALEDTWLPLERSARPLVSAMAPGPVATAAAAVFDYNPAEHPAFTPWRIPNLPISYNIGAIVGGSGSGKSTLLGGFGDASEPTWDPSRTVADHFDTDVAERLYAVGLSSVPTWLKPFHVLSNGERFRANLARRLHTGATVDEFTSVVDRNVAQAASRSLGKYVRATGIAGMVVATVHRDVLPWLEPDWVIDTDAGMWASRPRECLHRGPMVAQIYEVDRAMWQHFMGHHYLTPDLHPFARCYLATIRDTPVAFAAAIPFPHGHIRNAWRETRLVTMPDFQGLGVGPRLADWVAEAHVRGGYNYYSKTTHPRLGTYRDAHPNWVRVGSTRAPKNAPTSWGHRENGGWVGSARLSYSHKYVSEV